MPTAEFSERQYELAANLELAAGVGEFFAPSTPLEANLGIDVAVQPGDPRIWSLLGVKPPGGIKLTRGFFPGINLPQLPFAVSLFLQYKRPDYLSRRGGEWREHCESYYRIHFSRHQQERLLDLQMKVGQEAVVRYATPRCSTFAELFALQGGRILERSLFLDPGHVGRGHDRWTWSPNRPGLAHSEPEPAAAEELPELWTALAERALAGDQRSPRQHLSTLVETLPRARRRSRRDDQPEAMETSQVIAEISAVAEAASRAGASWNLVLLNERSGELGSSAATG